jgi:inorganic triphosphatase YgiF
MVNTQPQEIELKLLVVGLDGEQALNRLRRSPSLSRRTHRQQWLDNRYFDTPDGCLQQHRCALRVRQTRDTEAPAAKGQTSEPWIQTLKTAGVSQGGLSQRGEWESPVPGPRPYRDALAGTAWETLDPEDQWFARLQTRFSTRCVRTTWQIRRRDGTHIEVALDNGCVEARGREAPFLELEIELKQGDPQALFRLAAELATRVPCLPSNRSKAERGQALWADTLYQPTRSRPLSPVADETVQALAQRAMADMFDQFTRNLESLIWRDEPELVHQARVGWRRWRSMHRLLKAWLGEPSDIGPLRPLLDALGHQRNLDVACTETLPYWATSWPGEDTVWLDALERLEAERTTHREHLRQCLADPGTGLALLALAQGLWGMGQQAVPIRKRWARQRLGRWHRKLQRLLQHNAQGMVDVSTLHEARLLAKRLRYGSEAMAGVLSSRRQREAAKWMAEATAWQTRIGQSRDAWQAGACLKEIGAPETVVFFLRGVAASMDRAAQDLVDQSR